MHERPQGRGLVRLEPTRDHPWLAADSIAICAHEFHHAELVNVPAGSRYAWRVVRGAGIDGRHDGIVAGNVLASFSHLRDTSACSWAERFVGFVRRIKLARRHEASETATRGAVAGRPA
jgi:cobyrinic acid a,c-diamide synthase